MSLHLDLSPEALRQLEREDGVQEAARVLQEAYGDLAGTEALNRALCQERSDDKDQAVFWTKVYAELDDGSPSQQ